MKLNILNILVILGSLQGFLLALVFFINKKFNKKSNQFLALLIITLSLPNLINALKDAQVENEYPILEYLPVFWLYLLPFCLYYFIQYLIKPTYTFSKKEYLLLIPFIIHLGFQIFLFILFLTKSPLLKSGIPLLRDQNDLLWTCNVYFEAGAMLSTLIVLVIIIRKLNRYQDELFDNYSNIESQSLNWLKNTMGVSLFLWLLWFVPFAIGVESKHFYYPLFLGQAMVIYWLGYAMYSRRDLFETSEILSEEGKKKESIQELSYKTEEHYKKLLYLIQEEKLFKNPDLSMTLLAAKMKLSNGYLSQIINQKEGRNFFEFVNAYRVEEVKKNLADPSFDHFSVLGIALESGFKSKSTFNAVFKKMTGKTPSEYKRLLAEQE